MSAVQKFLLLAFGLGLTCLLVFYSNRVFHVGVKTIDLTRDKLERYNRIIEESDITMYNGEDVDGAMVLNIIKQYLGEYETGDTAPIYFYIKTSTSENTYYNSSSISSMQDFSSDKWIKPVSKFACTVVRDDNKVIIGISFVQK